VVCVDILGGREERKPYKIQRFHNIEMSGSLTSCTVSSELSYDYSFPCMPISELFFGSIYL
jgi:hypothetical protein